MEPERSSPCSQETATSPYPGTLPPHVLPLHSIFLKVHFNIIFPSKPRSSKWFLSLRFPHQNPVCISSLPRCYMPRQIVFLIVSPEQYLVRSTFHQSSSLCSFLHCLITSSRLGPNVFLSTVFSDTFSLCSSLNLIDQV
jgi:hypothetical protein